MRTVAIGILVLLVGCGSKPDAASVCAKIEATGVAKGCREDVPKVINARAQKMVAFDLVRVPGKGGHVLSFADSAAYEATVKAYEATAMLGGPHRYGNPTDLIFVQLNDGASLNDGKIVKAIVAGEPPPPSSAGAESPAPPPSTSAAAAPATAAPSEKPAAITTEDYFAAYQKNEVAADEKYKGKRLRTAGQIASIDKDAADRMVLQLQWGGGPLDRVHAHVLDTEKSKVAGLDKKQVVALECVGDGMILKIPRLKDCRVLIEGKKL